jgi:hypothetical protein
MDGSVDEVGVERWEVGGGRKEAFTVAHVEGAEKGQHKFLWLLVKDRL